MEDLAKRTSSVHILYSTDDPVIEVGKSVKVIRDVIKNHQYHEFTNKGHFCEEEMHSKEFPELLEIILE